MIDVFGKALLELLDDPGVAAITDRIRGHQPGPDDAKGPGEYVAFVVVTDLGGPPLPRTPVQFARLNVRCYGATPQGAKALYVACSNALHHIGPRVHGTVGLYISHDTTGGAEGQDPRTDQPYIDFVVELIATAAAVTV